MRVIRIIVPALFVLLIAGCEFMTYEEYSLPEYDGIFEWVEVTRNAEWSNRFDHASVVFDGKMWILGGYNPGQVKGDTYYEDVWSSSDGESWTLVTDNAPWKGRRGHSVINFDDGTGDAMFLIGGFSVDEETGYREYSNDVWKSRDGENWSEIKSRLYPIGDSTYRSDWFPRMDHSCVVATHQDTSYIYLIAGRTTLENINGRYSAWYFNDVWRSMDGITWDSLANNDYGIRAAQGATVDPSTGKIYIQGGVHGVVIEPEFNTSHPIKDWQAVWSSEDGINWIPEIDTSLESGLLWRADHQIQYYNNSLWSFPGKTTSNVHYHFAGSDHFPIWSVNENGLWSMDSEGEAFDARHGYTCVVFDDKIWILGGFTNRQGQANDVWVGEISN